MIPMSYIPSEEQASGTPIEIPTHATQTQHPWRTTLRTITQALLALAVAAPLIYQAATGHDPAAATGAAAMGLAVAGAISRVMALPAVEAFLRSYVPWLAPDGQPASPADHAPLKDRESL